jgi:hypothetical protein
MDDTSYTKSSQMSKLSLSEWYEGDRMGNILSFYWIEDSLLAVVQDREGELVELIITDL